MLKLTALVILCDAVYITAPGERRYDVLKEVRAATGVGVEEAKDMIAKMPALVKEGLRKKEAEALVAKLKAAGASAEVRPEGAEGTFAVRLESCGQSKIQVIKVVKDATGLGLADTKKLVESVPVTVKEGLSKEAADALVAKLNEVGGKATAALAGH